MERLRDRRVYIETYGCTYNHADTGWLIGILEGQGCTVTADPAKADAVVINTCTVVGWTERHMLRRIRRYADRPLFVTGCMPVVQAHLIHDAAPDAVLIMPEEIRGRSTAACTGVREGIGIVQVAAGCTGSCAYCITRFARGPLWSRAADEICREVTALVAGGVVEVQVTGQDVSAWGRDTGDELPSLIDAISAVPGDFRLRLGMMNPATAIPIAGDLSRAIMEGKVYAFVHLPVQSGSDAVLEAMNRGYTAGEFESLVATLRRDVPGIRISTDFITGFPTESDEDFTASLDLLRRVRPEKVNVTRYSPRPGTPAAALKPWPERIAKERSRLLDAAAKEIYREQNAEFVGRRCEVTVTCRKRNGSVVGRDDAYREVILQGEFRPGERLCAEITGNRTVYLTGRATASK
ncbi:MiaB/RimO family radical SAM methylthiotransferase [Methanofollis fontis]|uniref:Probable threonylcarbamoyladenosine tRNA methylthiotransferase n=1 Tax=Methanofollis fontis TaxID=2052832 RepID=A0A483CTC0_9EURY|nr:MiaB/RimO family radical SAM methylthiotransferase [Methanofollis fontis]TAJ44593.1 2-methylthioadenine synthetase [Methanofollis fontis]